MNEIAIIKAFNEGDERAFTQLYNELKGKVFIAAYKATGSRVEAEDIAIEAFVKLWNHRGKLHSYVHLSRWVYQVSFRIGLDFVKSAKAAVQVRELNEDKFDIGEEPTDFKEQEIVRLELIEMIYQISRSFVPYKRRVFELYFIQQKQIKEICEALALSRQTVYNTITKIKNQLSHERQINSRLGSLK